MDSIAASVHQYSAGPPAFQSMIVGIVHLTFTLSSAVASFLPP